MAVRFSLNETTAALDKFKDQFETERTYMSIITPERYEDAKTLIKNHFLPDEPLNVAFKLGFDDIVDERLSKYAAENLSLMMVNKATNEIMGVLVSNIINKGVGIDQRLKKTPRGDLMEFLTKKDEEIGFFDRYNVNEALYLYMLGVDRKYRRLGVGGKLISAAIQLARDIDLKVIKVSGSSNYSRKIFEHHRFEKLAVLPHKTYFWKGEPLSVRTKEHTETVIYGKPL